MAIAAGVEDGLGEEDRCKIVDSQVTASVVPKSGYQRGAIIVLIHVQPWSHTQLEDELNPNIGSNL